MDENTDNREAGGHAPAFSFERRFVLPLPLPRQLPAQPEQRSINNQLIHDTSLNKAPLVFDQGQVRMDDPAVVGDVGVVEGLAADALREFKTVRVIRLGLAEHLVELVLLPGHCSRVLRPLRILVYSFIRLMASRL
jgi:hypothetical protein